MKKLKYTVFLLFIGLLGQACSLKAYDYCKLAIGKKGQFIEAKKFLQNGPEDAHKIKRKYRKKAVQEIIPAIPKLAFNDFCHYSEFSPSIVENPLSRFLYCARGKRGPPIFLA